jgi:hypothetical protein
MDPRAHEGNYLEWLLWDIDVKNFGAKWNTAEFVEGPKKTRTWIVPSSYLFGAVRQRLQRNDQVPEIVFTLIGELVTRGIRQFWATISKAEGTEEIDLTFAGLVREDGR